MSPSPPPPLPLPALAAAAAAGDSGVGVSAGLSAAERCDGCDLDASPSSSNLDESRRKNRATIHDGYLSRSIEAVLKRNVTLTRCVVSQPHGMVLLLS